MTQLEKDIEDIKVFMNTNAFKGLYSINQHHIAMTLAAMETQLKYADGATVPAN